MSFAYRVVFLLSLALSTVACGPGFEPGPPRDPVARPLGPSDIFSGTHGLRKMAVQTDTKTNATGSFFLVAGSAKFDSAKQVTVTFAWRMHDGSYAISRLPLERFRVKLDESAAAPTIKFQWADRPGGFSAKRPLQELVDEHVYSAEVRVRPGDWPLDVELLLNEPAAGTAAKSSL